MRDRLLQKQESSCGGVEGDELQGDAARGAMAIFLPQHDRQSQQDTAEQVTVPMNELDDPKLKRRLNESEISVGDIRQQAINRSQQAEQSKQRSRQQSEPNRNRRFLQRE